MTNFYFIVFVHIINVVKLVIDIEIEIVVENVVEIVVEGVVEIVIKVVQLLKELLLHCPGTKLNDLPESRGRD